MRAHDGAGFTNIATTTGTFHLRGGRYGLMVVATFGGGNVTLQVLGPDASTWLTAATAITAAGAALVDLPEGTYRFAVTTATAVYVTISAVPGE